MRRVLFALMLAASGCSSSLDLTPAEGRPYRCIADAPDVAAGACPEAMFCGFDNLCHPSGIAAAYPCAEKRHCTGGWECGADGLCRDPANELLQPPASDPPALTAVALNPTLPWRRPDMVAANEPSPVVTPMGAFAAIPIAVVADGGVHAFLFSQQGIALSPQRRAPLIAATLTGVTDARAVAVRGSELVVVGPNQLTEYTWNFVTGAPVVSGALDAGVITSVQYAGDEYVPRLFAWNDTTVWMRGSAGWVPTPAPAPGLRTVTDVSAGALSVALGDQLYVTRVSPSQWLQVDGGAGGAAEWVMRPIPGITGNLCDGGVVQQTLRPVRVLKSEFPNIPSLLELAPLDGGPAPTVFAAGGWMDLNGCVPLTFIPQTTCPFCPSPAQLGRHLRVGGDPDGVVGTYRIEALCETVVNPSLSVVEGYEVSLGGARDGGCVHAPLQVPPLFTRPGESTFTPTAKKFVTAAATAENLRVTSPKARGNENVATWEDAIPLVLGDQPEVAGVIDFGPGPQIFALTLPDEAANITETRLYSQAPGLGLAYSALPNTGDALPAVFVENRASWLVLDTGLVIELSPGSQSGRLIARPGNFTGKLVQPFTARIIRTATGAEELIVTSLDTILSADLTGVVPDLNLATLDVRLSPQPRIPILSVIVLPDPPAGVRAAGYALTNGGLFSFTAITARQWASERVEIPLREWRELWLDRGRARLVYADGETLSLPGRIPLADGIEGKPFADFTRACGYSWAVRDDGLYRQDVEAGGKGVWTRIEVPELSLAAPLDEARFFTSGNKIHIFNATGRAVGLTAAACTSE